MITRMMDLPYHLNCRLRYDVGLSEFASADTIRAWLRSGAPCRGLGPVRRAELAALLDPPTPTEDHHVALAKSGRVPNPWPRRKSSA